MDRLRALEVFVEVVEQRGFAAAGRQLRLPRGVVSRYVQQLETQLGARLLNRTTRRVSVTEAGARFYRHCRTILATMQEAERELDEQRGKPRGRLRITAPMAFTELYLGGIFERFLRCYPEIAIDVECSDQFVDLVQTGFDAGVRIGELPPSTLVARKLAPSALLICGSPAYLKQHGRPESLEDLHHHACLGYVYQSVGQSWDFAGPSGKLTPRIASKHQTNSNHVLRELVLGGHGLAQLPSYLVAADIVAGRMEAVLDSYQDTSRSIYVVYPHRQHLPPKVRVFVEFLVEAFADGPPWQRDSGQSR